MWIRGREAIPGQPRVRETKADLAYEGLGDLVTLHSRALGTSPSTCFALWVLTGVVTNFNFNFNLI